MANLFTVLVANLQMLGFFGFVLPFVLFFAIVYALLIRSKWIENNRIIGVISLVFAFFIVGYGGAPFGTFLTQLFGAGAALLAGILVLVLMLAMTGAKFDDVLGKSTGVSAIVVIIGIIVFASLLGILGVRVNDQTVATLVMIIVFGAVVWYIAK